ncbi:MAG: fasciclin domain-containing protein [Cyanobacteria bacterium]|nr:fasciclin domain-containing protein [Cyanobacteriota bacterium]
MQLTTTVLQKLSLASLLTLGTLATLPTVVRSAPIPTPDQFPYITSKDEAGMMPTYTTSTSESITFAPMPMTNMANNTIVDVAVANGSFKTLTAALNAAGLVETLKGNGPFTVFAPTDAAFAKLPAGTVEMLLKPENKATLVRVLTYHIVSGNVLSTDLQSGAVNTLAGSPVKVMVGSGGVMVNNSTVQTANVKASNGVIHVIDTVLMPPSN